MFIVWGKKRVERKLGSVADFCPICREIRSFQMIRVGVASHVYYVSMGEGELAGFQATCDTCGVALKVEPTRYLVTKKDQRFAADVDSLVQETFPRLREVYANRLELESRLKRSRSTVSADEHRELLIEPFGLFNPIVAARFANSTEMDKRSGLGCLGTLLISGAVFFGSMSFHGPTQDRILIAALVLFGMGTAYTLFQMHLGPKRFFRTKILRSLVKALAPLEPTREEIDGCIQRCKNLGMQIGTVAKTEDIWRLLERRMSGLDDEDRMGRIR